MSTGQLRTFLEANGVHLLAIVFQIGSLYLATKALPVAILGTYLSLAAASAIAGALVGVGSSETLSTEIALSPDEIGDKATSALLNVVGSFLLLVLPVSYAESLFFEDTGLALILIFNGNFLLFLRLISLCESVALGFGRPASAAGTRLIYAVGQMIAFACLFLVPQEQRLAELAWLMLASGGLSAAIACSWLVRPHLVLRINFRALSWRRSLQFMFGQLLAASTANLDRVLAPVVLGELTAPLYVFTSRVAQVASIPVLTFFRMTYHRFFSVAKEEDALQEKRFIRHIVKSSLLIAILTAVATTLGYAAIVHLLAQQYRGTEQLFAVLSAGFFFSALYYSFVIQMSGHFELLKRNIVDVVAVCVLALSFALLPKDVELLWVGIAFVGPKAMAAAIAFSLRVRPQLSESAE